jgi:ribosomal protein S27AE
MTTNSTFCPRCGRNTSASDHSRIERALGSFLLTSQIAALSEHLDEGKINQVCPMCLVTLMAEAG